MRRCVFILTVALILFYVFSPHLMAQEESAPDKPARSWFNATFRGGFWMPEDSTWREFYGRWSNDMYFLELGFYPVRFMSVLGSVGGYYQRTHTIGKTTGEDSEEDLTMTLVPLEAGLSFRLRFKDDQLIVPYLSGAYDWVYYHEDPDPGEYADGWKEGPAAWGGLLILLDKADPEASTNLRMYYNVEHTYLEMTARYSYVGDGEGVDLSGWSYMLGISFDF